MAQSHVDPEKATSVAAAGGEAAGSAAEQGRTPEQAQAATEAAMREEADAQGVTITDEDINKIAEGTIKLLEARGAFEQAPPPGQSAPPSSETPSGSTGSTETPSDGSASGGSTPPSSPSTEQPPKKRTWAERFQGKA